MTKKISLNNYYNILLPLLLIGVLVIGFFTGCGSDGNNSFSNSVSASRLDGSVDVVENFLKKNYLRDPDSYKSREWGKLIKNSDGTFQVSHKFSAKNGFGGVDTETLIFCISTDSKEVHICNNSDLQRIARSEQKEKETKEIKEYAEKDFTNSLFEGIITENIDGIDEKSTIRGVLTKDGDILRGTIEAIEKETKYSLTGKIISDNEIAFELKNLQSGKTISLNGFIKVNQVSAYSTEHNISFYLTQNE